MKSIIVSTVSIDTPKGKFKLRHEGGSCFVPLPGQLLGLQEVHTGRHKGQVGLGGHRGLQAAWMVEDASGVVPRWCS